MPELILHGIPKHDYFVIAQPPSVLAPTVDSLEPGYVKPIISLKDPATQEIIQCEVNGFWTLDTEVFDSYNAFSLLAYGIEAKKLLKVLNRRYPEIELNHSVRFILLKKIA
jgi:hypothetical protein